MHVRLHSQNRRDVGSKNLGSSVKTASDVVGLITKQQISFARGHFNGWTKPKTTSTIGTVYTLSISVD